jgi:hypothetical protein
MTRLAKSTNPKHFPSRVQRKVDRTADISHHENNGRRRLARNDPTSPRSYNCNANRISKAGAPTMETVLKLNLIFLQIEVNITKFLVELRFFLKFNL